MIAVIKSETQYHEVLTRASALVDADPVPDSAEGRELEVLALLLQEYERQAFPLAPPSPLAAIRLRMEQLGLAPRDLVPYLGSRSKVSEVLAGKRPLSLSMIRALHAGLAIPLESLVSEEDDYQPTEAIEWDRFPVKEIIRRGWLSLDRTPRTRTVTYADAKAIMEDFFRPVGGVAMTLGVLHKTDYVRAARSSDRFALAAWAGHIRRLAEKEVVEAEFRAGDWDLGLLRELRALSRFDVGPRLAVQFLRERGIIVIVAPHLKRTRLDGAALLRTDGTPVIGLTLRHDRLDNFWFTLFHELMHIRLHLRSTVVQPLQAYFIDDLDVPPDASALEKVADGEAREALLPSSEWEASAVRFVVAPATVHQLARQVGVSESIVAGRVRYERKNYRLLSSMVGVGQVRSQFPGIAWPAEREQGE